MPPTAGAPQAPIPQTDAPDEAPAAGPEESAPHRSRRFLVVVALVGLCMGMTAPLTVLFATTLTTRPVVAGFAVASLGLSLLLVDVVGTTVVPRLQGRLLIWSSLAVFGLGALASAVAPSIGWMIAARVLQGFGAALFMSGGLHVVLRSTSGSGSGAAIGSFNAWWFGGIALGPLVGGLLAGAASGQDGYRLAFAVNGVVCLAVAALARVVLPAMPSRLSPQLSFPRLARPRPGIRLWPPLTIATVAQAVRGSAAPTVLPVLGTSALALDVTAVGVALSVLAIVDVVAMRHAGRLADRPGRRTLLLAGLLLGAAACAAAPLLDGGVAFTLWCAWLAVGLGITWVVPTAMVVDAVEDTESGIATYRIAADGAMLAGPVGAGLLVGAAGPVGAVLAMGGVLALTGAAALCTPNSAAQRPPIPLGTQPT